MWMDCTNNSMQFERCTGMRHKFMGVGDDMSFGGRMRNASIVTALFRVTRGDWRSLLAEEEFVADKGSGYGADSEYTEVSSVPLRITQ